MSTQERERTKAEWTYIGLRTGTDGKSLAVWLDTDGGRHVFPKGVSGMVGGVYEVTIIPDDDGSPAGAVITGGVDAPRFVRDGGDTRKGEWELEHAAERDRAKAKAAERAATDGGRAMGSLTLDEVALMMGTTSDRTKRRIILATVLDYLERGR